MRGPMMVRTAGLNPGGQLKRLIFAGSAVTPLMLACGEGHPEMVAEVLNLGADIPLSERTGIHPSAFCDGRVLDRQTRAGLPYCARST
jgi:hypothetical protein